MQVLADYGYKFNTKDSKIYIQNRILQAKNPRVADVIERIELEKQIQQKGDWYGVYKSKICLVDFEFICFFNSNYDDFFSILFFTRADRN